MIKSGTFVYFKCGHDFGGYSNWNCT